LETPVARLARLDERVRSLEAELLAARERIHTLATAIHPVAVLVPDVERHEHAIQELRVMLRAARWLVVILAPLLTLATGATPFIVRYAVRDALTIPLRGTP
jgi:hypothetical protein